MAKMRKKKKAQTAQVPVPPPPPGYSQKAFIGLAIALFAGISFAAYAGNDILHGHIKITKHPIPSKDNIPTSNEVSEPTVSSFHHQPSDSSDLTDKYGDIATSPAVADAIRKFDNNNVSNEAQVTYDTSHKAFEEFAYRMAMQRVRWRPPQKHGMALNMWPSQTAVMAQHFPALLTDPGPPDPKEIIMQLVSPAESPKYGMPLNPSALRTAAITQPSPLQPTDSGSLTSEEAIARMAGEPSDPIASIWPNKEAAKATNQKFFEEYTREHDGPIRVPALQRDHNWLAKHARKTANGYVAENGYAEDTNDRQSVVGVTDENGDEVTSIQYDPWGNHTILSGGTTMPTFGFQGMYYHEPSGLYLTPYRAYSPRLGRWLSRDPLGEAAGTNRYAFVRNNPINFIDPMGLYYEVVNNGTVGGIQNVTINVPLTYPTNAAPSVIASQIKSINSQWTGQFGNYNVTMNAFQSMNGLNVIDFNNPGTKYTGFELPPGMNTIPTGYSMKDLVCHGHWKPSTGGRVPHELGHLLGLGHPQKLDLTNIMGPNIFANGISGQQIQRIVGGSPWPAK